MASPLLLAMTAAMAATLVYVCWKVVSAFWVSPLRAYSQLRRNGFPGPTPTFPLGSIKEMRRLAVTSRPAGESSSSSGVISHDIHSAVFPYFAQWQISHGKVFVYWLGTEPFMYIADPEFLKAMSAGIMGKSWGKPRVFKQDREPMFGNGLVMVEGDDWVRHRHIITPAFTPPNLKAMSSLMVESTTQMLDKWSALIAAGEPTIDVEGHVTATAGEIIAKTSFGVGYESGRKVVEKLRAMQLTLFNSNRYVGVPFSKVMCPKKTLEAKKLGREIDSLLLSIISSRERNMVNGEGGGVGKNKDLLGLLLQENHVEGKLGKTLSRRELVDECKTFFFGGHETTALAISWTLMLLAKHPEWQHELRKEIREVAGENKEIDFTMLSSLKKMGWVMNEVLRLYSPAPNVQRQAKEDIHVGDRTIPKGTNMWIDVVAMHHDPKLWGEDVYEFRPERFEADPLYGGCKHKMGFMPFGFGGRMCVGRNLTMMEYKIVLSLILTRFSFSLSPSYVHSPAIVLSLRPAHGIPLVFQPLQS